MNTNVGPAEVARTEGGHRWWKKAASDNPHSVGSLLHYCWEAGRGQDVRSIDQLVRDWRETQP